MEQDQGPAVQSFVTLTSSLKRSGPRAQLFKTNVVVKNLSVNISNMPMFLLKKFEKLAKASRIFSTKKNSVFLVLKS